MGQPTALVTGAGGEMGRLLVPALKDLGFDVVALDLNPLPAETRSLCVETVEMDVRDRDGLKDLIGRHHPSRVLHLAAILSSHAERDPKLAHKVNVEATIAMFEMCRAAGPVRFLFPSSIAVYGLPDLTTKTAQGALKEWQWTSPTGMYGCNKVYCELVGAYESMRSREAGDGFDFRAIRFPGLISSETLPTGGTTDFAPEMIHAAAKDEPYACFVNKGTKLPFMTMPDAITALLKLAEADPEVLTRRVYNIRGFSCSAAEIREEVLRHFPDAQLTFDSIPEKQRIVDSWPEDVDDSRARRDWGLTYRHGFTEAFADYLTPALRKRYASLTTENPTGSGN